MAEQAYEQDAAAAVVLLTALSEIVEKSPVTYSTQGSEDLARHINGMKQAIIREAKVSDTVLQNAMAYALGEWRTELICTLFARENRITLGA
ncbi:hypothetical protein [uncultured Arthrobacter sp.]|uniref:hypothetical protein n=1 Tax=uncultured Arthrobacter sp. TaxID=114050 RepID=UPI0026066C71|nr:hypothetical protein [uncultured Arthrobacter sp.]